MEDHKTVNLCMKNMLPEWLRPRIVPLSVIVIVLLLLLVGSFVLLPTLRSNPHIVQVTPSDGADGVNPYAPLQIEFDQPIQTASLEQALSLEPPAPLTIEGQQTVTIQPQQGLQHNTTYHLTIDTQVKNSYGRQLQQPVTIAFTTTPYISARIVQPAKDAESVPVNTPLIVDFDRPVISEEQVDDAAQSLQHASTLPQPLTLHTADTTTVEGSGRWLSPTRYSFYPQQPLQPATTYTATIQARVTPDGHAHLQQPVTWSFSTEATLAVTTRPNDGAKDVPTDQSIEIQISPAVDIATAEQFVSLQEAGQNRRVNGTITRVSDTLFHFEPANPLKPDTRYEVHLANRIQTPSGTLLKTNRQRWQFTTMAPLAVAQVEPAPDAEQVLTSTNRILVHFNHPVVALTSSDRQANLPQPLTITPALEGKGYWLDTRTYVFAPLRGLAPATTYEATVASNLLDQTGEALQNDYTWSFTTIMPRVTRTVPKSGATYADPQRSIKIMFNQAMRAHSTLKAVDLLHKPSGRSVPGTVEMDGEQQVIFTPTDPLQRGEQYTIQVARDAQSANNNRRLEDDYQSTFRVAPWPALSETQPASGAWNVDPLKTINLSFSTPMDWASVAQNLTIDPEPTTVHTATNDTRFSIYTTLEPETDYVITVAPQAQDAYGTEIGDYQTLSFRTGSLPPSLSLVGAYEIGTYNAYNPIRVPLRHLNVPQVAYQLYRLDAEQTTHLLSNYEAWRTFTGDPATRVKEDQLELANTQNQEAISMLEMGDLAPGLYYLTVGQPANTDASTVDSEINDSLYDRQILVVTRYALTIKRSAKSLFVWAVDLASGDPVANLPLNLSMSSYANEAFAIETSRAGTTNQQGIATTPLSNEDPYAPLFLWSDDAERFVYATTSWDEGITPWSFDVSVNYTPATLTGNVYTDRPLYRPEHTVHIRGAVRAIEDEEYVLPAEHEQVWLKITDPKDNTVFCAALPVSGFGTFNTSIVLDSTAAPGSYQMNVSAGPPQEDHQPFITGFFNVAEYRKPAFEVAITPASDQLVRGEKLDIEIDASYFSGGAVDNAPLQWWLTADPLTFSSEAAPGYSFNDAEDPYAWYRGETDRSGGEMLSEGKATTSDNGTFTLNLPTEEVIEQLATDEQPYTGHTRLTLHAEVTDVDGQVIAAQRTVNLYAADFAVGLRPTGYVAEVSKPQEVALLTVDLQKQPLAERDLDIEIFRRTWFSVRERGADGRLYWTSSYSDTLIETRSTTTDERGRATITFTPDESGSYRIRASGEDASGNVVSASAFTWAYGGETFWGINDSNRIELIADKQRYQPGDTANILVPAPYNNMTALMTIERAGIIEHRVINLQDTTEMLEVPITAEHVPNIYVSLVLVKPGDEETVPDVRVGLVNLPVSVEQRELTIKVTPDKQETAPREEVVYSIQALDHAGKGVQAELSLALVDKALLSLADAPNPTLREAFYNQQPIGVRTAQSLTTLVDRVTQQLEAEAKGGGGSASADMLLRQDFPDTAYWNPSLVTDENGEAQVRVQLPDNLTTWRMTVQGLTADTLVGQAKNDILSTRSLLVRPSLPRFLTVGDSPVLRAIVHNNTTEQVEATVTIEVSGINLDTPAQQTVRVPAQGQTVVRWQGEIPATDQQNATLWFQVEAGGMQDAVKQEIPVQRFVTPEVVASAGQVYDAPILETITFPLPEGSDTATPPDAGTIKLEMLPSLTASLGRSIDYLAHYPYGCTEQTVSRFLPNAVLSQMYDRLGVQKDDLQRGLEQNLTLALQRLYSLQQLDGGWGWWAADASHPYLTAYVVQGLLAAQQAGYSVDELVLENALDYLAQSLDDDTRVQQTAAARAYLLFILAEADQADRGRTIALYDSRDQLPIYGRAYLLMTLLKLDGEQERVRTLTSELESHAILHTTTAHWEEQETDYWSMNSNARTTALALQALVRADPEHFLLPNAVRYLMQLREDGHWQTTQETAIILMALADYMAQSGELEADYAYRVMLDQNIVEEGQVDTNTLDEPITLTVDLEDIIQQPAAEEQTSALLMEKNGSGRLYYTLHMQYYQDAENVEPLDQGIEIERNYMTVNPDTLEPTGEPVDEVLVGDMVQVQLTVNLPEDVYYLTVEDMLPAGLEPLDTSLKTVSDLVDEPGMQEVSDEQKPDWWYFTETEIHDNRVAMFATHLSEGTYRYSYIARATTPGTYQTLPALAYQMYAPEVYGRTQGLVFAIAEP